MNMPLEASNLVDFNEIQHLEEIDRLSQLLFDTNQRINELKDYKQTVEEQIKQMVSHPDEGQKTYSVDHYKVVITTGYNYTLDEKEYEKVKATLDQKFNPVKTKTVFKVNKKLLLEARKYAPSEQLTLLSEIITETPKKLYITVTPKEEDK